jgi:acyl-CoA synthetase (AMP-forming)/AMP-acid ligase II
MNEGAKDRWAEQYIHHVVDDLATEFRARVDEEEVRQAVEDAFVSFSGSRIRAFVPILARRSARELLRARVREAG